MPELKCVLQACQGRQQLHCHLLDLVVILQRLHLREDQPFLCARVVFFASLWFWHLGQASISE